VSELARPLPAIHAVAPQLAPRYRPYAELTAAKPPPWLAHSSLWERAYHRVADHWPMASDVLIHRDYHPGNTLWLRGRLTAVVDWTQGSSGPAGIDVGAMRWSLAWVHGEEVADLFLGAYEDLAGARGDYDFFWDVLTAVDFIAAINSPEGIPNDAGFTRLEAHVDRALAQLG